MAPHTLIPLYQMIYNKGDRSYWPELSRELDQYVKDNALNMINYFYQELIRKN